MELAGDWGAGDRRRQSAEREAQPVQQKARLFRFGASIQSRNLSAILSFAVGYLFKANHPM
jgi:hypothetical protein